MPVVGRVAVMVGKGNEHLQAARRRKRHLLSDVGLYTYRRGELCP